MDLEVALRNPSKVTSLFSEKLPKPRALERLGELSGLEELHLTGARSLPASIGALTKLRTLTLGARLQDVPDELEAVGASLEELTLYETHPDVAERVVALLARSRTLREVSLMRAREVPPSLARLKGPFALTLAPGPGVDLPELVVVLRRAKGLRALDLQQRKKRPKDRDLPLAALAPLVQLRKLELRFGYTSLPDELGALRNLEELHLYSCKLARLPDGLKRLGKLRVLAADYGLGLTELPGWLSAWKALEELHLPANPALTALPESIGACSRLHTLVLWDCGLTALPASMARLGALRVVKLSGNAIAALPDGFPEVSTLELEGNPCAAQVRAARGTSVEHLYLDGDEEALPDDAFDAQPRRLRLQMRRLRRLPDSVGRLRHLEELELDCPALDVAHALGLLGGVKTLAKLSLGGKLGGPLPATIGRLRSLVKLEARGLGLTSLPAEIGALTRLEELWLAFNQLTTLPAELARCTKLRTLHLFKNPLPTVPEVVGELPGLAHLSVERCPLTDLPASLARLGSLSCEHQAGLRLWETAFRAPPAVLADLRVEWLAFAKNDPPWDGPALLRALAKNQHLRTLTFEDGSLTALPSEVGLLTRLRHLELHGLSDVTLPPALAGCLALERVDLRRAPADAKAAKACLPPGRWKQEKGSSWFRFVRTG